ncbi:MAG: hypothetical protein ABIQ90_12850 [Polaromonas sp.]
MLAKLNFDQARARGAFFVEAYPAGPHSPSYRFMGFVLVFEEAGFTGFTGFAEVACEGRRRHVMQLKLPGLVAK